LSANGSFTYTPSANYIGTDTFRYQAKDAAAALSNIATVTITVTTFSVSIAPVSGALVAANDSQITIEATAPAIRGVTAYGTLTSYAAGHFSHSPRGIFSGPETFHFQAKDIGALSKVAT
jgi:uncharacterized membrane protein